jgi:hypothetical protein
MELRQIIDNIEAWQAVYEYSKQPTAEAVEAALIGEAVTLRKGDGLTVKTNCVNLHVDRLNDDRVTIVVHYEGTRNGATSSASLELLFSNGEWRGAYGRRGNLPTVYSGGKFSPFPQGAVDLIHTYYGDKIRALVEAGTLDGAQALAEALIQERRSRISRGLHSARMALYDVELGISR